MCAPARAPGPHPVVSTLRIIAPVRPGRGYSAVPPLHPGHAALFGLCVWSLPAEDGPHQPLRKTPIAVGRPTPFDPLDPYLLAKRLESPPSATSSGLAESQQQQRHSEEEGDSAGYRRAAAAAAAPLTPTHNFSPAPRDLSGDHAGDPPPMTGGPCLAGVATGPEPLSAEALTAAAAPLAPPRLPTDAPNTAPNTAAAWLTRTMEVEAAPAGPQTVNICTPRAATAGAAPATATGTTTPDREGYDPHAGPDGDEQLPPTPLENTDDGELFAPAPRTGAVTPTDPSATKAWRQQRSLVIDVDEDPDPGPPQPQHVAIDDDDDVFCRGHRLPSPDLGARDQDACSLSASPTGRDHKAPPTPDRGGSARTSRSGTLAPGALRDRTHTRRRWGLGTHRTHSRTPTSTGPPPTRATR